MCCYCCYHCSDDWWRRERKLKKKSIQKGLTFFLHFTLIYPLISGMCRFFYVRLPLPYLIPSLPSLASWLPSLLLLLSFFIFFSHFYLTECLMWIGMDSFFSVCFLFICSRLSCQWPLFISLSSVVPAHTNTLSAKRTHTHILLLSDLIFGIETFVCSEIDIVVTEETDWHRYVCIHCRTAPRISNYTINKHISIYFGMTESF